MELFSYSDLLIQGVVASQFFILKIFQIASAKYLLH